MKKRIIMWMLAALLPVMVWGQTEKLIDGIYYKLYSSARQAIVSSPSNGYYSGVVTIPDGFTDDNITYSVTQIDSKAFYGCEGLTVVTLPSSIVKIGALAFQDCTNLEAINFPDGLLEIDWQAFFGCSSLKRIIIPASVNSISGDSFSGCTGLIAIDVLEGNETYDSRNGCNAIISTADNELIQGCRETVIPSDVTSIGEDAFSYMTNIIHVSVPEGVTILKWGAFTGCNGLKSVTLPNSLTTIETYGFNYCVSLEEVSIGKGIITIDDLAFQNCTSLNVLKIYATVPPTIAADEDPFIIYGGSSFRNNITLYVPQASVDAYKADSYWGQFKEVLPLPNKCATPSITLVDGKVSCTCDTEDVTFKTTISRELTGNDVLVNGTYTIRVVASREGYEDSDPVDYTVDMTEETVTMEGDVNGDGVVNAADAVRVANIIMNNDGQVE
ncbi:MAG: leucine-rich repeat protein [Prevotella sp.]|nr:leucine-rich repeat protein [Prevotella sp.]